MALKDRTIERLRRRMMLLKRSVAANLGPEKDGVLFNENATAKSGVRHNEEVIENLQAITL